MENDNTFYHTGKNVFVLDGFHTCQKKHVGYVALVATSEIFCFNFRQFKKPHKVHRWANTGCTFELPCSHLINIREQGMVGWELVKV